MGGRIKGGECDQAGMTCQGHGHLRPLWGVRQVTELKGVRMAERPLARQKARGRAGTTVGHRPGSGQRERLEVARGSARSRCGTWDWRWHRYEIFLNMYFFLFLILNFLKASTVYFLVLSRDHQGMLESSNKMCKAKDRVLGREP